MNVLLEFSRSGLAEHREAIELIRTQIIEHDHKLTSDLLEKSSKPAKPALPEGVYSALVKAIANADCVIIEGSVVSLSLGFVLTEAINLGKPVLFLVEDNQLSLQNRFVTSISSRLLTHHRYSDLDHLKTIVSNFLKHNQDIKTRFNLVLPNRLNSYITIRSHQQKTSKTEYIIGLIEADLNKHHH